MNRSIDGSIESKLVLFALVGLVNTNEAAAEPLEVKFVT